jgi:hypothetical protein
LPEAAGTKRRRRRRRGPRDAEPGEALAAEGQTLPVGPVV